MHSKQFKKLMPCPKCESMNTIYTIECRSRPATIMDDNRDHDEIRQFEMWFNTSRFVAVECLSCWYFRDIDRKKARGKLI